MALRWLDYDSDERPVESLSEPHDATMLLFKRKFLPAIRAGEKTQTIRLWKHRMMRQGQRSYIPGVGGVRITVVEAVEIGALTDADAVPDGFATAAALRDELRSIYGERLEEGYQAYRVGFECIAEERVAKGGAEAARADA